jgi:hypothetical protein
MRYAFLSCFAIFAWLSVAAGQDTAKEISSGDTLQQPGGYSRLDRALAEDSAQARISASDSIQQTRPTTSYIGSPERPFSLFDYRNIVSAGISLSWYYYAENPEIVHDLPLLGVPKSTEYGTIISLSLGETFYNWKNRLVIRPRVDLLVGYDDTYDGSYQGDPVLNSLGDTVAYAFAPLKFQKTNISLFAECDAGYAFPFAKFPFFMYTGLDFKLWYRNLLNNSNVLFSSEASNSETYYWFSVPLGVNIVRPINSRWIMGGDANVNFMFFGSMQVSQSVGNVPSGYPAVTLGNQASVRIELFIEKKRDNKPAMRFAPYFLYYSFSRSNSAVAQASDGTSLSFYEPSSNSFLVGATLSWEFLGNGNK